MREILGLSGIDRSLQTCLVPNELVETDVLIKCTRNRKMNVNTSATPRSEIFSIPSVVSKRLLGLMSL